ncbi:MAG: hypothetical protein AAGM84_12860 [Pseudomonadota bacterium]
MTRLTAPLAGLMTAATLASAAAAQDTSALGLELNTAGPSQNGCTLTFVLSNGLEMDIDQLVAETVLFSPDGGVILLTLFDFGALPAGVPRVRQFEVPGTQCAGIGQVLVNGVATCTIGGAASDACSQSLSVSSRIDIALEG